MRACQSFCKNNISTKNPQYLLWDYTRSLTFIVYPFPVEKCLWRPPYLRHINTNAQKWAPLFFCCQHSQLHAKSRPSGPPNRPYDTFQHLSTDITANHQLRSPRQCVIAPILSKTGFFEEAMRSRIGKKVRKNEILCVLPYIQLCGLPISFWDEPYLFQTDPGTTPVGWNAYYHWLLGPQKVPHKPIRWSSHSSL